jgi:hypothetical protein
MEPSSRNSPVGVQLARRRWARKLSCASTVDSTCRLVGLFNVANIRRRRCGLHTHRSEVKVASPSCSEQLSGDLSRASF